MAYVDTILAIVMIPWLVWLFIGLPLVFSHRYDVGHITFHTTHRLSFDERKALSQMVASAENQLKRMGMAIDDLKADVFLDKSDLFFKLSLVPGMQLMDFGSAFTFGSTLLLPNADIAHDRLVLQSKQTYALSLALAHELVHVWQNRRYGLRFFPIIVQKTWLVEGYAVYVTDDKIMYDQKILRRIFANNDASFERHSGEAYALWGLMVKHAIKDMHISVDDLHRGKVSYDEVYRSLLAKYRLPNK